MMINFPIIHKYKIFCFQCLVVLPADTSVEIIPHPMCNIITSSARLEYLPAPSFFQRHSVKK
jgi:hypothetical protein